MPRILVACEFSGVVRDAFRKQGYDAWSNDLKGVEAEGENKSFHLTGDCLGYLNEGWDLVIAHPPCTYLTTAAEWAYKDGPYHQKTKPGTLTGAARRAARVEAIEFAKSILRCRANRIALENPVGVLSTAVRKPNQIIHPWMFGDDASKATCLWTKNLPSLRPTKIIRNPRWIACECCDEHFCTIHRTHVFECLCPDVDSFRAKGVDPYIEGGRFGNQTPSGQNNLPPSKGRAKARSTTYPGIAEAMADQWGRILETQSSETQS